MEGLFVDSIPRVLLARILVQLYIIPQRLVNDSRFNLIDILANGLQRYGHTSNLNGLFKFCLHQAMESTGNAGDATWWWKDLATHHLNDWERLDLAYSKDQSEPVNLHIQIMAEEARKGAIHIKYGHEVAMTRDNRLFYQYHGRAVRIDSVLGSTMDFLRGIHDAQGTTMEALDQLVHSRLDQFMEDHNALLRQQENMRQASSDYILMGALMRRYDDLQPEWQLYLRDYISSDNGKLWRILAELNSDRLETKITSDQAMADIRGEGVLNDQGQPVEPSTSSRAFRPIYLFYCNRDMVAESVNSLEGGTETQAPNENPTESGITLADYVLDDDRGYVYENPEDDKTCKVCGIDEIVEDLNNMYYCDSCNLGVHQLCEDPPIADFEVELDPWYCRECSRLKGIPLPRPNHLNDMALLPVKRSGDSSFFDPKRRRDGEGQ
ncbi:hypothetical protein BJV82DRAFT_674761 [Fennellomyces sp. T-0311]|nr:hypothetical protein BJV82DRAFT_674761 [Fennellomyces sp. T-0311]